jgi:periplasmic divalent cation tolerance protein
VAASYCVILSTASSREEAEKLAELLVRRQLAACVQITPITSVYSWGGEFHKDPEQLLLIKTRVDLYDAVEAAILGDHSYEVPEIIQLPVERGLDRYLAWVEEQTSPR